MQGKIIVATGATSGIGEKAAQALARIGARILLVARDPTRAEATLKSLEGNGHKAYLADLSSIRETKRVGAEIASDFPAIDVLINNAGAIFAERQETAEGLEATFALNHMSYFTLTAILLPTIKGRIVSTASRAHFGPPLDFDDLQIQKGYNSWRAYQRSKLANILFTRELARRLPEGVTANCLHPGVVATRFANAAGGWVAPVFGLVKRFALSPDQGADTLIYLASSPQVAGVNGAYYAKRKLADLSMPAQSDEAARRLWDLSEKLMAAH